MSSPSNRPLSPHLQVYRLPFSAISSILHRITGAALSVGSIMIAWWLLAAMAGEAYYNVAMNFAKSPLGLFMIFGWSVALYYHLFNGIRHLLWDCVLLFKMQNANRAGYVVILATIIATAVTWYIAWSPQ